MPPIEQQKEIIIKLANVIHRSAEEGYEEASCTFKYFVADDGSKAVEEIFYYILGCAMKRVHLVYDHQHRSSLLVPKLHDLMKSHTGGSWTEFTLTLDSSGRATTKFKYPE